MPELTSHTTHRRGFLGRLAAGAAALGLGGLVTPLEAAPPPPPPTRRSGAGSNNPQFEAWLNKMTGKHKMIYDVPEPNSGLDRKSTRLNSSHSQISYAVFCLKKKK